MRKLLVLVLLAVAVSALQEAQAHDNEVSQQVEPLSAEDPYSSPKTPKSQPKTPKSQPPKTPKSQPKKTPKMGKMGKVGKMGKMGKVPKMPAVKPNGEPKTSPLSTKPNPKPFVPKVQPPPRAKGGMAAGISAGSSSGPAVVHDSLPSIGYQEPTGVRYLYYSYAAYCSANSLTQWNCKWCSGNDYTLTDVSTVSDSATNTFGYVGYNSAHNEIVVSFRGTDPVSLQNWISDLTFGKTNLDFMGTTGVQVHSGFLAAYQNVADATQAAVSSLRSQYPSATVYFTGHSLGGALTTLATLDAVVSWGVDGGHIGHITFGSPRVGDSNFATLFTQKVGANNHLRLVNDADVVPHLPMEMMGFHHISTEVWLKGDTAKVCNSSGEDPSCSDSLLIAASVWDHIHYYNYLQSC